nr:putative hydrolase C777.06C [Ipomoea batatas]
MATAAVAGMNGGLEPQSALIFLGTGCSSAVPNALCLIRPSDPPCQVCSQSLSVPPEQNPNYRCNTSLLIDYSPRNGEHKYILIDVGKTFREQVLRWFTRYRIPCVDSIVLTHEHADAVLGLDDIRAVQPFSPTNDIDPTPVFLNQYAMDRYNPKPWNIKKKLKAGQEVRRVAQLDWQIIENDCTKPFVASGLEFVPLPVMHGEDYVCLGFLFGGKYRVAYISDVSRFLPSTESCEYFLMCPSTGSHNVHLCFPQTLDAIKRLCPKRAFLIGMTHEFDHHKDNAFLMEWSKREGIQVQLAYDGLRIIWYGSWIKKSSDKDRDSLSSSLLSMLSSGVSSMAIILEHGFYEAFAGEARDGTPAARFYTGDTVSMNALSLSTREVDLNRFSYACLAIFKDRFLRMDGAKGGACLKSRGLSRVCAVFVWRSLQSCYSYILNDDYRSSVLAYLDGMSMDIKYDIFRVVYVSGENAMDFHFFPPHRLLETKGVHDSNKVAD